MVNKYISKLKLSCITNIYVRNLIGNWQTLIDQIKQIIRSIFEF